MSEYYEEEANSTYEVKAVSDSKKEDTCKESCPIINGRQASINCEICAEQFSSKEGHVPRMLQCGHTFCEECLEKLRCSKSIYFGYRIKNSCQYVICCPKCKTENVVNSPSTTLPKNYSFLDLIEDVLEIESNRVKQNCQEHPNYNLDMFCHKEEESICLNCAVYGQHKGHCVSRLSGFADHQKTAIKFNLNCVENMISDCEELQEALNTRRSTIENKVRDIRQYITDRFFAVQDGIKKVLDAKLNKVLEQVDQMNGVQTILLDEHDKIALNTEELAELKERSESFLSEATEQDLAKEKTLVSAMEACRKKLRNRELYTQHMYEVKIDDFDHILEIVRDLVDSWNCKVYETKPATVESMATVLENFSQCPLKSLCSLFDDEKPDEKICQNPFERIGCEIRNTNDTLP